MTEYTKSLVNAALALYGDNPHTWQAIADVMIMTCDMREASDAESDAEGDEE